MEVRGVEAAVRLALMADEEEKVGEAERGRIASFVSACVSVSHCRGSRAGWQGSEASIQHSYGSAVAGQKEKKRGEHGGFLGW